jgi:2-keto-3-deoxy-L-rhamnonate aldolase RhmA
MKLCLITDDLTTAAAAERGGIDRIMIDLERDGKAARQAGRDLFLSHHRLETVAIMARALKRAELVVRVNPPSGRSPGEVAAVLDAGAQFLMLPFFHEPAEVRRWMRLVRGRCRVVLLVETQSAVRRIDQIVSVPGVDEVHVGLNDLSISIGTQDIFEPLRTGMIDHIARSVHRLGKPFGFGGIARLSRRDLPIDPQRMLAEQVRLGATRGWLGRSFRHGLEGASASGELAREAAAIHRAVESWNKASTQELAVNRELLLAQTERWRRLRQDAAPNPGAIGRSHQGLERRAATERPTEWPSVRHRLTAG